MIILIGGASHAGKTKLADNLMKNLHIPYLSLDHLKMGLIRSGLTNLTVDDDEKLTLYLFNIASEIIKTAIENEQSLIIEGCYIPFDFKKYFTESELEHINYTCLVMSRKYIENHFNDIIECRNVIETRKYDFDLSITQLIEEHEHNEKMCKKFNLDYYLIDNEYDVDFTKVNLRLPF